MPRRQDNRGVAPYSRTLRVNQVLRQVVADELERLADADERLRLVTVTSIETTSDLRQATVFLSSLSDEAATALDDRRVQVQKAVARQTQFKRTPQLTFVQDPAVLTGNRIEDLLRQIRESDDAAGRVETDGRDDNYK
ncbi:MAG TPA: 30S ribosome-binding factor RbfA [Acidimicrobiales bacterium]